MFKSHPSQPNQQNGSFDGEVNHYRPSVPISIYRELANELQSAQTQLATLKSQNQQLVKQNQLLRREVEKVLAGMKNLQQWTTEFDPLGRPVGEGNLPPEKAPTPPREHPIASESPRYGDEMNPDDLILEIANEPDLRPQSTERSSDVSMWLLCIAIALTVLTAFGIGFIYVRSNNNSNS